MPKTFNLLKFNYYYVNHDWDSDQQLHLLVMFKQQVFLSTNHAIYGSLEPKNCGTFKFTRIASAKGFELFPYIYYYLDIQSLCEYI